jgi:CheY-like chemotaxis protein
VIKSLLSKEGYAVALANDGFDALRILKTEDVGLVLTAPKMSGVNGTEILKHAIRVNPDIAVVILTTFGRSSNDMVSILTVLYRWQVMRTPYPLIKENTKDPKNRRISIILMFPTHNGEASSP